MNVTKARKSRFKYWLILFQNTLLQLEIQNQSLFSSAAFMSFGKQCQGCFHFVDLRSMYQAHLCSFSASLQDTEVQVLSCPPTKCFSIPPSSASAALQKFSSPFNSIYFPLVIKTEDLGFSSIFLSFTLQCIKPANTDTSSFRMSSRLLFSFPPFFCC